MIDTHFHFGGSIPAKTIWDLVQEEQSFYLANSLDDVIRQTTFKSGSFANFLNCFRILDEISWDQEKLTNTIRDVADIMLKNQVEYTLIDFSITKYLKTMKLHRHELIRLFYDTFNEIIPGKFGLLLSIKYETIEMQMKSILSLIDCDKAAECLVGLDIVGDESLFNKEFLRDLKKWKDAGKLVRVHVGEVGNVKNLEDAIHCLDITNIAHGIDIVDCDPGTIEIAKRKDIIFDLAITSNLKMRNISIGDHPIHKMIGMGLPITIGSDDPMVFQTNIAGEFELLPESYKNLIMSVSRGMISRYDKHFRSSQAAVVSA